MQLLRGCPIKWFKHDSNANSDSKLQNVLLDYGLEGYGLYWYCIELIAGKVDADNITFSLEHDARIIARNTGCTPQKVEEMMRYFVSVGLFENSDGVITCMKMAKRLDQSMTSNKAMRAIIDQIKAKTEPDSPEPRLLTDESHDGVMTNHDGVMQEEIRSEEKRVDKSKEGKKTVSQKLDFSGWPEIPSDDLIAEWMILRGKQKAPVTQRVVNMFGKQLTIASKSGFTIEQCIEQCLCKGWRGFEAEWMANQKPSCKALSPQKTPRAFGE